MTVDGYGFSGALITSNDEMLDVRYLTKAQPGYATLMSLINDPDLYRCGVEWAIDRSIAWPAIAVSRFLE